MNIETDGGDAAFAEFEQAGDVEVGVPAVEEKAQEEKPAAKPEIEDNIGDADENDSEEEGTGEEEAKKKPDPKESQINRLKREKRELAQRLKEVESNSLSARLEAIEKSLQGGKSNDTQRTGEKPAPDASDADKYPLGHLDSGYQEDRLQWLAEKLAAEQVDAVLQREQENERNQSIQREQTELLGKVDDLSAKGSELFEDFQESVVEAGMRGDWDLTQTTFEAAHEAENGVQILYDLAQDPKEATRVAKLSPLGQLKYVAERDAELAKGKTARTKPGAGAPPQNTARGANSRVQINPATDNLDDFEKAWELDAKKSR